MFSSKQKFKEAFGGYSKMEPGDFLWISGIPGHSSLKASIEDPRSILETHLIL